MPESSAIRAFAAVSVDSGLKARVRDLQERLNALIHTKVVRWVPSDHLHLTLKFYGHLPLENLPALTSALRSSCDAIAPFTLSLCGLGCFPSAQKPSVIWLGVRGDLAILELLHKEIDNRTKALSGHSEDREFRPHLTIGRVKASPAEARRVGQTVQTQQLPELGRWSVREIELIQSTLTPQGSSYRSLAVIPLTKA